MGHWACWGPRLPMTLYRTPSLNETRREQKLGPFNDIFDFVVGLVLNQ